MRDPALPIPLNSDERLASKISDLDRRVGALERLNHQANVLVDGVRVRVELGRTESGRYGLRVYDNAGSLVHDYTTPA